MLGIRHTAMNDATAMDVVDCTEDYAHKIRCITKKERENEHQGTAKDEFRMLTLHNSCLSHISCQIARHRHKDRSRGIGCAVSEKENDLSD